MGIFIKKEERGKNKQAAATFPLYVSISSPSHNTQSRTVIINLDIVTSAHRGR